MDFKKILLQKINALLIGKLTVPEFRKDYYFYYLDEVPDNALTDDELMFFGDVQEELDWTSKNPDDESRSYGWMDYEQYILYVKRVTEDFLKTGKYNSSKWGIFKKEILKID